MDAMERLKRLKQITLEDGIFFALVVFALGSCISGHLGKNSEMVAIALCVIRLLRGNIPMERLRVVKQLALVLGIFFGTMMISSLRTGLSNFINYGIMDWWFETLLLFCVIIGVQNKKQVTILYTLLFVSILIVDFHIFYETAHGAVRATGFFKAVARSSAFYALIIPAIAVFAVDERIGKKARIVCWGMLVLGLAAVFLTGTRGIWLSIPLTLLVVFVYGTGSWKKPLRFMAVGTLCVCAIAMLAPPALRNRVAAGYLSHDGSITARIAMWEGAVHMFQDYPLLGVGMGNFNKYWRDQYCPPQHPGWKKFVAPHSSSLLYLSEGGLLGIAGYGAFYGYLMLWSWKRRRTRRGLLLLGSTLSIFLYGLTDTPLGAHEVLRVYWFLIGLAFADEAVEKLEKRSPEESRDLKMGAISDTGAAK